MMPTIKGYDAQSIINWGMSGGKLSLVVLQEEVEEKLLYWKEKVPSRRFLL